MPPSSFNSLAKQEQVKKVKREILPLLDNIIAEDQLQNKEKLKEYNITDENIVGLKKFLSSIIQKDCLCGMCIDVNEVNILPPEFNFLIEAVVKKLGK